LYIRGRACKEDVECYFTVSFVIFRVKEIYKILIKNLKGKDFFVDKSAEGTEINWAIKFVIVYRVRKVELEAYVLLICNKNNGISLQPGLE